ncbi:hypothetical protein MCAG_04027 [Micromonospora sp. ATCC 39149]|uniref:hypothetical protein n=1 Tax=Micromonospora sp. (strain ATCC 39149 / NRRL 15099 / SCC 1413) TaxID=219305 RepID=UPI0001A5099E|nr:hypothetical protein [Micromonospora sp. ATCC 39149]EEP73700.1 hypothetical protein MCAG_04027 [Micromonospora sp. ATCC 39149]
MMSTGAPVDWALAPQPVGAARQDRAWYLTIARDHIRAEWSDRRARVKPLRADIPAETADLRETLGVHP